MCMQDALADHKPTFNRCSVVYVYALAGITCGHSMSWPGGCGSAHKTPMGINKQLQGQPGMYIRAPCSHALVRDLEPSEAYERPCLSPGERRKGQRKQHSVGEMNHLRYLLQPQLPLGMESPRPITIPLSNHRLRYG